MSELVVSTLKHEGSSTNNITLSSNGDVAVGGASVLTRATSGTVLQTIQDLGTSALSYTNSNGLFQNRNITPSASSSKIHVQGTFIWCGDNPNGYFSLERKIGSGSWNTLMHIAGYDEAGYPGNAWTTSYEFLDSPATVDVVEYRVYWYHIGQNGGTMFRNRSQNNDSNSLYSSRLGTSVMILQEIAG